MAAVLEWLVSGYFRAVELLERYLAAKGASAHRVIAEHLHGLERELVEVLADAVQPDAVPADPDRGVAGVARDILRDVAGVASGLLEHSEGDDSASSPTVSEARAP